MQLKAEAMESDLRRAHQSHLTVCRTELHMGYNLLAPLRYIHTYIYNIYA